MTNKKYLFKNISIFLCLVPMLLLSIMCLIPSKQKMDTYASDQVLVPYSFVSSTLNMPASSYTSSGTYDMTSMISAKVSFTYDNGAVSCRVFGSFLRSDLVNIRTFDTTFNLYNSGSSQILLFETKTHGIYVTVNYSSTIITKDINRVEFSSTNTGEQRYNTIKYYDVSNNWISFSILWRYITNTANYQNFSFSNTTYYLTLSQVDNNTYYQSGYTDGYNQGFVDGSDSGYQDGYNAGEIIGYGNGYNAGVEHGSDYSFNSLIGAVIDAPVSAFTSLLNFDLFGVNILGLVTGLLSLAVIVLIIKLCMGGR